MRADPLSHSPPAPEVDTAVPDSHSTSAFQSPAESSSVTRHRRIDPNTLDQLELLLLRAISAVAALAVVWLLARFAVQFNGAPAFPNARWWMVLLPLAMVLTPVRHYRGLRDDLTEKNLQWVSAVLNSFLGMASVWLLTRLLQAPSLPLEYAAMTLLILPTVIVCGRKLMHAYLNRMDRMQRVVIVGADEQGVLTAQHLALSAPDMHIVGFLDDRKTRPFTSELPAPLLGSTSLLASMQSQVDSVVIALPNTARARIRELSTVFRASCAQVYLSPDVGVLQNDLANHSQAAQHNLLLLGMHPLPLSNRILKRAFDLLFSLAALTAFIPIGLVIAVIIKLSSPGPVFFIQKRFGLGHRLFSAFKFRSMAFDAQHASKEIELTQRGDARVTPIGAFLRRTSLDEFPQFLNVLLGQMSVVGPRPHPPGVKAGDRAYEMVITEFVERYKVPAGITGWAQIKGHRGNTFTEEHLTTRFAYDIQYIQNWSFELDVWIVLKTALGGFKDTNAF